MPRRKRHSIPGDTPTELATQSQAHPVDDGVATLELREEELVARTEMRELGEVAIHTEVDEVPARLEVDAYREEVLIEHEPVGDVVSERQEPWDEDGALVIPVYEERLVVTKRLILTERIRVRRVGTTERQLFEDSVRRERLVVDDANASGRVRELYPTADAESDVSDDSSRADEAESGGLLENLVRKALE